MGDKMGGSLLGAVFAAALLCLTQSDDAVAEARTVALPSIENGIAAPRILYIENPRFPTVTKDELFEVFQNASDLVGEHFNIDLVKPDEIESSSIDEIFTDLVSKARRGFARVIGDFRNGSVDWDTVKQFLIEQIKTQEASLAEQIAFARPYLVAEPASRDIDAFADAVTETFKTRLMYWTTAKLDDGNPIIGAVPGRDDLPLNEYVYWALMAKSGVEAEIILTNQLIASVEYSPTPIHSAIRGGITGGSTEYNPSSQLGSSVWVSLAPFLIGNEHIDSLRDGKSYTREDALRYAGAMLAHELGHQLLHLGHPWQNRACLMRPAEALKFASWVDGLDARKCLIGSGEAMTPGTLQIPIW